MPSIEFTVNGLSQIVAALKNYPSISKPVFADTINASLAVLKKNANDTNFQFKTPRSQRTGQLAESFNRGINLATPNNLQGSIGPTVNYADFVYSGTQAHIIQIRNKQVLANVDTGEIFGKTVHSPGSAANPFLDRILSVSEKETQQLFANAIDKVLSLITQYEGS
jgi:hypothetical protein